MPSLGPEWYKYAFQYTQAHNLDSQTFHLLAVLIDWADEHGGSIYPGLDKLGGTISKSRRTASRHLAILVEHELLVKDRPGGFTNGGSATTFYHLNLRKLSSGTSVADSGPSVAHNTNKDLMPVDKVLEINTPSNTMDSGPPMAQCQPHLYINEEMETMTRDLAYGLVDQMIAKGWKNAKYRSDADEEEKWMIPLRHLVMSFPIDRDYLPPALEWIVEQSERPLKFPADTAMRKLAVEEALKQVLPSGREVHNMPIPVGVEVPPAPPTAEEVEDAARLKELNIAWAREMADQHAEREKRQQDEDDLRLAAQRGEARRYAQQMRVWDKADKAAHQESDAAFLAEMEALLAQPRHQAQP